MEGIQKGQGSKEVALRIAWLCGVDMNILGTELIAW